MARSSLAQAVEAQEIACNVLHALLDLRLCACPLCRTQAAQRWNRVTHANVACDPVKLVGRDVELVGARVANQEIFTLNARCAQPDKPLEASNTVLLVNDIVARVDLCYSSRLRRDDDDTATAIEQFATILHEGTQAAPV